MASGKRRELLNLRAPVRDNPLITEERLATLQHGATTEAGYTLRRATASDVEPLLQTVSSSFAPVWSFEVARALGPSLVKGEATEWAEELPEGPAVHVALDGDGAVVAFAAHDGNNRELGWFGPMGTLDHHRGHGLGEALLLGCLLQHTQSSRGWRHRLGRAGRFLLTSLRRRRRSPLCGLRGAVMQGIFATPLRAMVLCAGMGSRLGGISDELPKPLLPVCNHPLLTYALALCRGYGMREVAVNLHHLGHLITNTVGNGASLGMTCVTRRKQRCSARAVASARWPTF